MSYDKHVWLRKELISAAKLNNIENGIAAATNALELLKLQVNAAHQLNAHVYGIKFDKTTHTCTRLFDAANITTDTTNFCHKGTINPNYDNPFDNIYPWSEFKLCNVDLDKFLADNFDSIYTAKELTYQQVTFNVAAYLRSLKGDKELAQVLYSLGSNYAFLTNILRKSVYEYYVGRRYILKNQRNIVNKFEQKMQPQMDDFKLLQLDMIISSIEAKWVDSA